MKRCFVTVTRSGYLVYHVPVGVPGNPKKPDFSALFDSGGGNNLIGSDRGKS